MGSNDIASVCFSNNSSTRVNTLLANAASAPWFRSRDGRGADAASIAPGESREMAPPSTWEDANLALPAGE